MYDTFTTIKISKISNILSLRILNVLHLKHFHACNSSSYCQFYLGQVLCLTVSCGRSWWGVVLHGLYPPYYNEIKLFVAPAHCCSLIFRIYCSFMSPQLHGASFGSYFATFCYKGLLLFFDASGETLNWTSVYTILKLFLMLFYFWGNSPIIMTIESHGGGWELIFGGGMTF